MRQHALEVIVRGGTVVDGTGRPGFVADVGIIGDRVVQIGDLSQAQAPHVLDAAGCIVTPGFIDIHSHSDFTLLVDPRAQSQIAQGVTTEVVGNCGHGCAPIVDPALVTGNIYGYTSEVALDWRTQAGYFARLEEACPAVNVAALVPNGNLRLAVVGLEDRPARPDEVREMGRLLEQGLDEGAFGYSTGLEYATERACSEEELTALCRINARRGGLYATHVRNRDTQALEAIAEALRTARGAGVRLQISHIIPRRAGDEDTWMRALELVDDAHDSGLDVAFDSHTRLYGTTNFSVMLPPSELTASAHELAIRLRDSRVRAQIKQHPSIIAGWGVGGWERVFLYSGTRRRDWLGKSMAELTPPGGDGMDAVLNILAAEADNPHAPMGICHCHEEEWLRVTMQHPLCMIGSDATALCPDGPLKESTFLGAYTWAAWFFRRLVREEAELSVEDAVHKLTEMPAARVGLTDRGRLEPGQHADVVVLDPNQFGERGTLQAPNQLAVGVVHVIVNGVVTREGGVETGRRGGQVLRRA